MVLPKAHIIYLSGPLQIFNEFNEANNEQVEIHICGPKSEVELQQNISIKIAEQLPSSLKAGDVVFVIGLKHDQDVLDSEAVKETVDWLQVRYKRSSEDVAYCGICTGALLMAKAGLLDDKICTTLPVLKDELEGIAPNAKPLKNRIFVKDQNVWTSAGVSAGIDIALELIGSSFGAKAASDISRKLTLHMKRSNDYSYLASQMNYRNHDDAEIHRVQDYLADHVNNEIDEKALASMVNASYRTLFRRFKAQIGIGIKEYQLQLRMDRAKSLLLNTTMSIADVASECGYAEPQSFRKTWMKQVGMTPSQFKTNMYDECV